MSTTTRSNGSARRPAGGEAVGPEHASVEKKGVRHRQRACVRRGRTEGRPRRAGVTLQEGGEVVFERKDRGRAILAGGDEAMATHRGGADGGMGG